MLRLLPPLRLLLLVERPQRADTKYHTDCLAQNPLGKDDSEHVDASL